MSKDEAAIEGQIQASGADKGPRLTPEHIDACIASEVCGRASDLFKDFPTSKALQTLTICVITTRSGFCLVGTSACASPENYNAEIGNKIARDNARNQMWALEGYLLKDRLAQRGDPVR